MTGLREKLYAIKDGKIDPPPIAKTLGINLVEIGEGTATTRMKVEGRFHKLAQRSPELYVGEELPLPFRHPFRH
jgi:hypothetical protein